MTIQKRIEQKTEELDQVGKTINQIQKAIQESQMKAIRLDGAITVLKEMEGEEKKESKN